jgi:gamma-glutamyltranspeptidase/glutathione hydrolase
MNKIIIGFVSIISCLSVSCGTVGSESVYRRGAVVCSDRTAAETGVDILKNGGNAVDAACATALALAVTYPQAGNIGGGGFALIYLADSAEVFFLDFRETAPAAASAELYLDSAGRFDPQKSLIGPLAAGTPGTVAGLWEMHRRFGHSQWADLVRPARTLALQGVIVDSSLAAALADDEKSLCRFDATSRIFLPGNELPRPGDRLIQRDLAATLKRIERDGKDGFYGGETADLIAAYCARNGGLITVDDLESYEAVWRQPVRFRYRDLDIYAAGLPSSGGIVMGQILKMLETYELERYTAGNPHYMHLFTEAARRAYADRAEYLGDPDFVADLSGQLLDSGYLLSRQRSIDPRHATASSEILAGMPKVRHESDQTTHLVVADEKGNIVSLTYTINAWFGCKAVVPGAGFFLNNEMDDFAIVPDEPNQFGLTGGDANRIEPGKRMLSSMTPTIILRGGLPYLALGSPGGSKIITAVAQTIINYCIYRMPLHKAVSHPRFHHQWRPDTLYVERNGYDPAVIQRLTEMGHHVIERSPFGEVTAIGFSEDRRFMTGAADPRRGGGYAAGY